MVRPAAGPRADSGCIVRRGAATQPDIETAVPAEFAPRDDGRLARRFAGWEGFPRPGYIARPEASLATRNSAPLQLSMPSTKPIHIQPKGWGEEHWIHNDDKYCGKVLILKKGKRCSLHFHVKKTETFYVQKGKVQMELQQKTGERETF